MVFENRVMGRYLGVRGTGKRGWRKLQTETIYDLYSITVAYPGIFFGGGFNKFS
jgi:hypothetical protein